MTGLQEFLIDLSFELGRPAHELAATLPVRELALYQHYAVKRLLPSRRLSMQLANLAMLIHQTMGGAKNVKLSDYMFEATEEVEVPEDEAADFFGFNPTMTREM